MKPKGLSWLCVSYSLQTVELGYTYAESNSCYFFFNVWHVNQALIGIESVRVWHCRVQCTRG